MAEALILSEITNHILQIQFNRLDKKNALTQAMYQELNSILGEAAQDNTVHVVLFKSNQNCFTGGNDLADFLQAKSQESLKAVIQFLHTIHQFPKPIICAISGPAVGVGTTMLLHSELIYADDTAYFQLPFVNLALVPEAGSSLLLPNMVGYPKAAELLLLAEKFSAQKAKEIGLINEVVTQDVNAYALEKAKLLAAKPPKAIQLAKKLLKKPNQNTVTQTINEECEYFYAQLQSPEAKMIMSQFFAKK